MYKTEEILNSGRSKFMWKNSNLEEELLLYLLVIVTAHFSLLAPFFVPPWSVVCRQSSVVSGQWSVVCGLCDYQVKPKVQWCGVVWCGVVTRAEGVAL